MEVDRTDRTPEGFLSMIRDAVAKAETAGWDIPSFIDRLNGQFFAEAMEKGYDGWIVCRLDETNHSIGVDVEGWSKDPDGPSGGR